MLTALSARALELPHGTFTLALAADPSVRLTVDGSAPRPLLIGKSSICDLVLPDATVSRRHCSVEVVGPRLHLVDVGSSNGSWVAGIQFREAWLAGGERLIVGKTEIVVTRHAEAPNPEVPFARSFGRLLGESRSMRRLYPLCVRLAASRVPVLIEGETGTGKEVLAEALHEEGPLANEPFIVFDCTAVPPGLVESQLFGHEKGSFTGATGLRRGVFEQAHKGTLFIDEIGDLDLSLQPKLLRAIERGQIMRVGGERWVDVDVRIISATRRNLDAEVQAGRFRDDLFHRLAVTRLELPPLRSRRDDIPMLASHFHRQARGDGELDEQMLARWRDEPWPGNVRELRNAVSRWVALGHDDLPPDDLSDDDLAPPVSAHAKAPSKGDLIDDVLSRGLSLAEARTRVVDEFERRYLQSVLDAHGGIVTRAAEASGIARRHFQRLRAKVR